MCVISHWIHCIFLMKMSCYRCKCISFQSIFHSKMLSFPGPTAARPCRKAQKHDRQSVSDNLLGVSKFWISSKDQRIIMCTRYMTLCCHQHNDELGALLMEQKREGRFNYTRVHLCKSFAVEVPVSAWCTNLKVRWSFAALYLLAAVLPQWLRAVRFCCVADSQCRTSCVLRM